MKSADRANITDSYHKNIESQAETPLRIEFSYNDQGTDKDFNKQTLTDDFKRATGTIDDIAARVKQGNAFCAGNLVSIPGAKRADLNFADSQLLWLDFDNTIYDDQGNKLYCEKLTLKQALADPFIKKFAALVYTSASHTLDWNKFRIVFVLPEKVRLKAKLKALIKKLMSAFPGADTACSGAVNVFYGNTNAEIPLLNNSAILPIEWVESAIAEPLAFSSINSAEYQQISYPVASDSIPQADLVRHLMKNLNPSLMNWDDWRDCLFAFHAAGLSRAEVIRWSAKSVKHEELGFNDVWNHIDPKGKRQLTVLTILKRYCIPFNPKNQKKAESQTEKQLREAEEAKKREEYKRKLRGYWIKSRKYTADRFIDKKFITAELLKELVEAYEIISIKAAMGQGKTRALNEFFRMIIAGVIMSGSRNNLLMQTVADFNKKDEAGNEVEHQFYHLNDDKGSQLLGDKYLRLASCVDSNWKFKDSDFDDKYLVLDEAVSHELHLLLSSTVEKKGRRSVLAKFEQAVKRASKILMLDGNMKDSTVAYIQAIRGCSNDAVIKVENIRKTTPLNINIITAIDHKDAIKKSINSPIVANILELALANKSIPLGEPRAIGFIADNQKVGEALDRILTKNGIKVWRIDRKTSANKDEKENIKVPNEYIERNQIEVVIMSPSVAEGFNIDLMNYFVKGFALFFGLLGTDTQMQFIRRIRHAYKWGIWCAEFWRTDKLEIANNQFSKHMQEMFTESLNSNLIDIYGENSSDIIIKKYQEQLEEFKDDIHSKRAIDLLAMLAYERSNSRECLIYALKEAGHNVIEGSQARNIEVEAEVKTTKKEISVENAERVFNAADITEAQYKELKEKLDRSQEEYDMCSKAYHKLLLPGIEASAEWNAELIEKLESKAISIKGIERYWLLRNLDIARVIKKDELKKAISYECSIDSDDLGISEYSWAREFRIKNIFIPDLTNDFSMLKALKDIGMLNIIDSEIPLTASSELIENALKKIKYSKHLQTLLGKKSEKTASMQYVSRLAEKIGVRMISMGATGDRKNSERSYLFITPENADESDIRAVYECIENRFRVKSQDVDDSERLVFPVQVSLQQYANNRKARNDDRESHNSFLISSKLDDEAKRLIYSLTDEALAEEDKNIRSEKLCGIKGMIKEMESCFGEV